MPDDLDDAIESAAAQPQQASVDGQSVTQRSLSELIEADRYLARKRAQAAANPNFGVRVKKVTFGSAE